MGKKKKKLRVCEYEVIKSPRGEWSRCLWSETRAFSSIDAACEYVQCARVMGDGLSRLEVRRGRDDVVVAIRNGSYWAIDEEGF